jgi:hypothetical protein
MMPFRRTTFSVWQRLLQVVAGVLALWSMMVAAQAPAAQTAKPAPAAETKAARMLIWEVSRADQPSMKAWIFGTVHVGKAEFYPLPAAVAKAFAEADVLAVEADVTDQGALEKATSLMLYQPPDSLVTRLPAPLVDRLRNQCRRLGLPFEALQSVKPFAAAGLLVVTEYSRQGMEQAQGLDLHFIQQARSVSKPIVELEGLVEQARIVTSMSRDDDTIAAGQDRIGETELGDRGRDLGDLGIRMGARVAGIRYQLGRGPLLDLVGKPGDGHARPPSRSLATASKVCPVAASVTGTSGKFCWKRFTVTSTYSGAISVARTFRPVRWAASRVVPEPQKGSKTISLASV